MTVVLSALVGLCIFLGARLLAAHTENTALRANVAFLKSRLRGS
jgi:hypothetical protein